jgi:SLT domain-containing protein
VLALGRVGAVHCSGQQATYASGQAAYAGPNGYIASALQKAGITNPTAVKNWTNGLDVMAPRLSSTYNPSAVDLTDSNAYGKNQVDGNPLNADRGAFQMTPATFAEYHVAGTSTDIYDPVANGAAAINYMEHRYDVNPNGANLASNVQEANPNLPPLGY